MAAMKNTAIMDYYTGKSVFITGASGFMGKVLLEKLLYSCRGLDSIYILLRPKRGKAPNDRLKDMFALPLFARLLEAQPNAVQKVIYVEGDLDSEGLGLSTKNLELLASKINIVFHVGATLKLEATLKDAVAQNTAGTARVLELAKRMQRLEVFVHYSTAFCSADIDTFEERVYECRDSPQDVIDVTRWLNDEALVKATPSIIAPHPNTYTYTKRLAEKLVADCGGSMPVCIIRPSIVCPATFEPLPGWVDSLNGPMGLLVAAGKGVLRSMHAKGENPAHVIPVDYAINASIIAAYKRGTAPVKLKDVPVYNLTQHAESPITFQEILDRGRHFVYKNPFEMQIWYPDGDIRASKWQHKLYCIFLHWLPAYFLDFLLLIFGQRRFMVRIQGKIHDGLDLLEFFAVRKWNFRSENFLNMRKELSEEDNKIFFTQCNNVDIEQYMLGSVLGARQYLMKEDLSSLPRCRRKQNVMYVIHKAVTWTVYLMLLWLLTALVTGLKSLYDLACDDISKLPILGGLLASFLH